MCAVASCDSLDVSVHASKNGEIFRWILEEWSHKQLGSIGKRKKYKTITDSRVEEANMLDRI